MSSSSPPRAIPASPPNSSPARGLYLLTLFSALFLDGAFLFVFVVNPIDYCLTSREAIDYVDVSFVYVRMVAALLAAALAFLGFSLALRPVRDERRMERALAVLAAQALAALAVSGGLLGPSSEPRRRAIHWCLLVHGAGGCLAALHALLTRRGALELPMALDEVDTQPAFRAHFEDGRGRPSLERLERFLEVRSVRASIRAQLRRSNSSLAWLGGALVVLSLCNFGLELRRTLGSDPPLLPPADIARLNAPKPVEAYFGDLPSQPRGHSRVVLLVVSGLRRDALGAVPAFRKLLASPEFSRDSLSLALRAGPPSTSMSQWLALATGASAALTGVYGDKRLAEPAFDSIFRQARLHGLSSFATGSPWFTELFHSQLLRPQRFFAEGAVPPTYGTWSGWPQPPSYEQKAGDGFVAGDEADQQRMLLLHRALAASQPTHDRARQAAVEEEEEEERRVNRALGASAAAATPAADDYEAATQPSIAAADADGGGFPATKRSLLRRRKQKAVLAARGDGGYPGVYGGGEGGGEGGGGGGVEGGGGSRPIDTRAPDHAAASVDGAEAEPARHLFELLVGQLSEADVQSHCSGASPSADPRGAYVEALGKAARRIEALVRDLDAATTLLIASDHGTVDAGGSGGSEPTSVDVPLIAYRAGSQLGLGAANIKTPPLGVRRTDGWRTVDVAPTIAALLGVPVPRQSEGVPIAPLLPLANQAALERTHQDVFHERQRLAASLASTLDVRLSSSERGLLASDPPGGVEALQAAIEALSGAHAAILARANRAGAFLSGSITGVAAALLLLLLLAMVQRSSFADLRVAYQPSPGQYANRRAFIFALLGVVCFYASSIGLFVLLIRLRGYASWDSTVLHFPTELVVYLLDVSLPALISAFVLYRTLHFPFLVTPGDEPTPEAPPARESGRGRRGGGGGGGGRRSSRRRDDDDDESASAYSYSDDDDRETQPSRRLSYGQDGRGAAGGDGDGDEEVYFFRRLAVACSRSSGVLTEYLRCLCLGHAPVYSDLAMIYLLKVYTLLFATASLLLLAFLQARAYTFLLPHLLLVRFDVEADWTYRFQLLTLQLMTLCLMLVSTLSMLTWPSEDLSAAYYDRLYSLVLLKFERRRGATAKSDDVLAMLDEETEALVRARYQPPFEKDAD